MILKPLSFLSWRKVRWEGRKEENGIIGCNWVQLEKLRKRFRQIRVNEITQRQRIIPSRQIFSTVTFYFSMMVEYTQPTENIFYIEFL